MEAGEIKKQKQRQNLSNEKFFAKASQKNYLKIPNSSQRVVKQWNFFFAKAKNSNFFVKNFNAQILSLLLFSCGWIELVNFIFMI